MGDGAFSNVYKALEKKTGRKVAVKVVRKYELNSSQVRKRFPPSVYTIPGILRLPCAGHAGIKAEATFVPLVSFITFTPHLSTTR